MLLGLVGKPSCGKSTFFKAATLAEVEIASYPFTTIKANHGIGYVRVECIDKEFNTQCNPAKGFCISHQRFVSIDLMDVAGLVPGASEGKGLGNKFLDDLREADAFIHIVDASGKTDTLGKQTEGHDPCDDVKFLEEELNAWYHNILLKVWKGFSRKAELESTKFSEAVAKQFSGLKVKEEQVKKVLLKLALPEKPSSWNEKQLKYFASELRKISKPMIIAANKCDDEDAVKNIENLKKNFKEHLIIPCSADSELALRQAAKAGLIEYIPGEKTFLIKKELTEKQKQALDKIKKNVLEKYEFGTGVQQILNTAVFDLLKYIAIFPGSPNKLKDSKGRILPDCFLLPSGSTALDFAYHLHTDFGKNFIRAIDARTKMAWGKDHVLKHRDILEIISR
ncbi:MAG: redox-regulated ATPase YchF [Nanoarchaeota archaeon]|nr:redox-regulated ATPase YchF [Nanoarchaeota archaeon]